MSKNTTKLSKRRSLSLFKLQNNYYAFSYRDEKLLQNGNKEKWAVARSPNSKYVLMKKKPTQIQIDAFGGGVSSITNSSRVFSMSSGNITDLAKATSAKSHANKNNTEHLLRNHFKLGASVSLNKIESPEGRKNAKKKPTLSFKQSAATTTIKNSKIKQIIKAQKETNPVKPVQKRNFAQNPSSKESTTNSIKIPNMMTMSINNSFSPFASINNGSEGIECPEEIHFFLVHSVQKAKLISSTFE